MRNSPFSAEILIYIESTDVSDILFELKRRGITQAHFTNGIYGAEPKLIVPTTLAGFKHVVDKHAQEVDQNGSPLPIIVAVNSNESIRRLQKEGLEPQDVRSRKIAEPLTQMFENRKIIILYYDEETPTELYKSLSQYQHTRTLHKWGYGTGVEAPKIEGAESFEVVYAFPLPNDIKPICWHDTPHEAQNNIHVRDLRGDLIDKSGVLFEVPNVLKDYQSDARKPNSSIASSSESLGMRLGT